MLAASFRGAVIYSHGKITLACDLPDETPVMLFNEATMKHGSFSISGNKESEVLTGVDVSYIDTTNHYKRETVRVDQEGSNDGIVKAQIENIASLDLVGVTRRSQALRFAQYQIASSKYIRRLCNFTTSTDALQLIPGDVIAVSQQASGVAYGFGGKIHADSAVQASNTNVFLEHFSAPSLSSADFAATNLLVLRVIKVKDERIDLYQVSKTRFALTKTDNVNSGFDLATINPNKKYNDITRSWDAYTAFTANTRPEKGDLWTFGELEEESNPYTAKSDKLFKVIELTRQPSDETVDIVATEYISNIYVDSDTFIDYKPTSYTNLQSGLTVPPVPNFTFEKNVRSTLDGSIITDGLLTASTEKEGFGITYITQYELSKPTGVSLVANASLSGVSGQSLSIDQSNLFTGATSLPSVTLTGKNGFSSPAGEVKLLCTAIENTDTFGGTEDGKIQLTLEGFGVVFDENFNRSILEANDSGVFGTLKGTDHITIPVNEKDQQQGLFNFVGFAGTITALSQPITDFSVASNTVKITNIRTEDVTLINKIPSTPFYITLNQLLDSRFYNNNSFYVSGQDSTYIKSGEITGNETITVDLPVTPRDKAFIRFFVDGFEKSSGQYTFNPNKTVELNNANIVYTSIGSDSSFRVEVDYYTVPVFEIGDNVQTSHANVFSITDTSYDPLSAKYNVQLTTNSIFRIYTHTEPKLNLGGFNFTNITPDPVGSIGNISCGSGTFDYDTNRFPGLFRLANSRVYNLEIGSESGGDLQIYHNGSNSIIKNSTGITKIQADDIRIQSADDSESLAKFVKD